jgi:hypothetical protein
MASQGVQLLRLRGDEGVKRGKAVGYAGLLGQGWSNNLKIKEILGLNPPRLPTSVCRLSKSLIKSFLLNIF